jgi:hypothetical protein
MTLKMDVLYLNSFKPLMIFFGAHIYYTYTMLRFLFKKILKRNLVYMEYSLRFGKRSRLG